MRTAMLLVGLLAAATGVAATSNDLTIKGIRLHESKDDVLNAHPEAQCAMETYCTYRDTLGGVDCEFALIFDDAGLNNLNIRFEPDAFDQVTAALIGKFGNPATNQRGTVQNGFGAKFDDHIYVWKGKGWQLQAKKRSKATESSIQFFSTDAQRDEERAKKNKSDI